MTYGQITAASRSHYSQLKQKRTLAKSQAQARTAMPLATFVIIFIAICFLVVIYLLQVNSAHSYSYVINDLNQQKQLLQEEYEALSLEAVKLESNQEVSGNLPAGYQLPETVYLD